MLTTLFLAEDRVREALREGEQARLVSTVSGARKRQSSRQHPLDIGSRLASWFTARALDQLTREAERLFRENCTDPLLASYSVGLPLSGLPEIRTALSLRGEQQGQERLVDVVRAVIARDWRQLSPVQIEDAIDLYLCSMGWARQPRRLTLLAPTASMEVDSYAC